MTKIAFIGAGSTIFMKNVIGDALTFDSLRNADIALMDIDAERLKESAIVAKTLIRDTGAPARISTHNRLGPALDGADFVIVAFQIGGYEPSTVIDFKVPKSFGLEQTIGDTLGVGGIMRALRTVPHLFEVAEAMRKYCPDAWLLNYVNPMAINMWCLNAACPDIRQMGLCHSVQNTVQELAHDLDMRPQDIRHHVAGVNHVAFFLKLEDPEGNDLYPRLRAGYDEGSLPKPPLLMPRCPNRVRYEMMRHFGYFCTESSEHLAEYMPWFIKQARPDLVEQFAIPLDEYPKRCIEQRQEWAQQSGELTSGAPLNHTKSHEQGADIINAIVTGKPIMAYANMPNRGQIPQLQMDATVEMPCLIDSNGVQPTLVQNIPPQLVTIMHSQIAVQELVTNAILNEEIEHIYHAAKMDPHTAAELDLRQIDALVDQLRRAHFETDMLPEWACRDLIQEQEALMA